MILVHFVPSSLGCVKGGRVSWKLCCSKQACERTRDNPFIEADIGTQLSVIC